MSSMIQCDKCKKNMDADSHKDDLMGNTNSEYETSRFPKCCADCLFAMIDDPDMGDFTCIYKAWPKEIDSEIAYIKRADWCELE